MVDMSQLSYSVRFKLKRIIISSVHDYIFFNSNQTNNFLFCIIKI